jgi:integrase/recombinase XerD
MAKVTKNRFQNLKNQVKRGKSDGRKSRRLSVLFYPKALATKKGLSTVYCRLTFNTQRKDYSTGVTCKSGEFDARTRKVANDRKATILLRDIEIQAQKAFTDLVLTDRVIDLSTVWGLINGGSIPDSTPKFNQLIELFSEQSNDAYQVGEISKAALKKQDIFGKHILSFLQTRYGQVIQLDNVIPADAKALVLFCKKQRGLGNDYTMAVVQHFKRLLNFAIENEWIVRNPLMNFRRKLNKTFGEVLTEKEVETLQKAILFSPTLDRVRNIFLLQCYTGLSYIDLKKATHSHILTDEITGFQYLKIYRQKTNIPSIVPLINEAKAIINKYVNDTYCIENGNLLIPVFSNQKLNNYLKELGGVVKIGKRLTTHVGRRTAATFFLNAGVPLSTVSTILGHTNPIITKARYAKLNPDTAINEVNKAMKKRRKKKDNNDENDLQVAV